MSNASIAIREASPEDVPELRLMHVRSLRLLGRTHHDFEVIEAFLPHVGTLGGVPLFRALGYRGGAPVVVQLPGEHPFVGIAMEKRLSAVTLKAAA